MGAWTRPGSATIHFTFILRVVAHLFEIVSDTPSIVTDFHFAQTIALEKGVLWLVELALRRVRAWAN